MNKILSIIVAVLMLFSSIQTSAQYQPSAENLQARKEFRDAGFGIFIHWGIYSMLGRGEWVLNREDVSLPEYTRLARGFYPSQFDADAWVKAFKDAGAGYLTITSRHHDGFSMFHTQYSDYNIVDATPFGRDILKEISAACQKYGLKLHIYYSQIDWMRDDYVKIGRTGHDASRRLDGKWDDYKTFMLNQLRELLTNYGPIGAIWYDGMWDRDEFKGEDYAQTWDIYNQYNLIHSLQSSCLVGSNHHSNIYEGEDFQLFERDKPGENFVGYSSQDISALPLETCQTMNESWGYHISDNNYKSSNELIKYLVTTSARNANLLLNIGPRPDGTLPEEALTRLADIGKWMQTYRKTVCDGVRGGIVAPHQWGATTQRGNTLYVHILDDCKDDCIFLPYTGNRVINAKEFASSNAVEYTQTKQGIILNLKNRPDVVDYVVELTFKNNL